MMDILSWKVLLEDYLQDLTLYLFNPVQRYQKETYLNGFPCVCLIKIIGIN